MRHIRSGLTFQNYIQNQNHGDTILRINSYYSLFIMREVISLSPRHKYSDEAPARLSRACCRFVITLVFQRLIDWSHVINVNTSFRRLYVSCVQADAGGGEQPALTSTNVFAAAQWSSGGVAPLPSRRRSRTTRARRAEP